MRSSVGRDTLAHTQENRGYTHTDPKSKKRIGEPTADDIFYTEHLSRKKEARRERKKQARLETARAAQAGAIESIARELESGEAEEGIESLFADGKMNITSWLARYYKAVENSGRSGAYISGDQLRDFTAGTIISERISGGIEHFFGEDELFASEEKNKTPVGFDVVSEKLEISKENAIKLVALVSFKDAAGTIKNLFEYRNEPGWDFLNDQVSDKEFAALQKLFKDAAFVDELLAELIRQNADVIQKMMSIKKMDSFVRVHLMPNPYMDQSESGNLFGTDVVKQKYISLFEKEGNSGLRYVESYEFLFGEFSKDEFLRLFPEWHKAEWHEHYTYKRRYELVVPSENKKKLKNHEPADAESQDASREEAATGEDSKIEGRVHVLSESRILELLGKREETKVADCVAPYTEPAGADREGMTVSPQKSREPGNSDVYVFAPYERDAATYVEAAKTARERMERESGLKEKLHIFFADLWPQMLIARADEVVNDELMEEIEKAIELLRDAGGDSVSEHFSTLSRLSENPRANMREIQDVAARLRNNETLHENGMYVHAEVINRERKKGAERENVYLLSGVSFEIDETHEFNVDGTITRVHELGDRVDTLNQNAPGLGFTYAGDNHGVVLKGTIRENANYIVIPYLNDDTEYLVGRGEKVHSLTGNIQEALRRDYPKNPTGTQMQAIYQSRYKSTRDHEQQHKEDEVRGVQSSMSPVQRRVAQETTAYLRSIAGRPEDAEPNAPFADLVKIVQLYISSSTDPYTKMGDLYGIYKKASERILHLLADKLSGIEMDTKILKENPVEGCRIILEEALKLDRDGLRELTTEILAEEILRQKGAYSLSNFEVIQKSTAESVRRVDTVRAVDNVREERGQDEAPRINFQTSIPEYTPDNPPDKKKVRFSPLRL